MLLNWSLSQELLNQIPVSHPLEHALYLIIAINVAYLSRLPVLYDFMGFKIFQYCLFRRGKTFMPDKHEHAILLFRHNGLFETKLVHGRICCVQPFPNVFIRRVRELIQ